MEVILQKDFFGPDGSLYRSKGPKTSVTIPNEFRSKLPDGSEIVRQKVSAPVEEPDPFEHRKASIEVAEAEMLTKVNEEAEITRKKTVRRKKVSE